MRFSTSGFISFEHEPVRTLVNTLKGSMVSLLYGLIILYPFLRCLASVYRTAAY